MEIFHAFFVLRPTPNKPSLTTRPPPCSLPSLHRHQRLQRTAVPITEMISSRAPCQVPGLPAPQSSFCCLPSPGRNVEKSTSSAKCSIWFGVLTLVGLGTAPCFLLPEIRLPLASVSFVQFFLPLLTSSSLFFLSLSPLFPQERLPHLSLTFQGSSLQVTQGPHSLYSQTEPSLSFET